MSYKFKLLAEINQLSQAHEDPIAFAKSKGFTGSEDYLIGAAKGWVRETLKGLHTYVDLAINQAEVDAKKMAQYELAMKGKEAEADEYVPPIDWQGMAKELVSDGCLLQVHYGPYGVGCSLLDPDLQNGINVAQKKSEQEAVREAYARRGELRNADAWKSGVWR
jgi:hypothetical protein